MTTGFPWQENITKQLAGIKLTRKYTDERGEYQVDLLRVRTIAYATSPYIIDYELWVEVRWLSGEKQGQKEEVSLGDTFQDDRRKRIPFGEDYYEQVNSFLWEILIECWPIQPVHIVNIFK